MNINHAVEEKVEGDLLKAIFDRQRSLVEKYHHIEIKSGLIPDLSWPAQLDDRKAQYLLKDYSWRVTEELGEALDAKNHNDHFQEELIDGLHFLTEMTIFAGRDYDTLLPEGTPLHNPDDRLKDLVENARNNIDISCGLRDDQLDYWTTKFIEQLAMMCNCLKNKPWKQSMMKTDRTAFYNRLGQAWVCYTTILVVAGMDAEEIAMVYLKKSQVNQFRQRSNY